MLASFDNVVISGDAANAPEPGSMPLMSGAALALGARRWFRK
jgi:PEP-CTERM motif